MVNYSAKMIFLSNYPNEILINYSLKIHELNFENFKDVEESFVSFAFS